MKYVIKIEGLVAGVPTRYDGTYLRYFDFEDCDPGEAHLDTVATPEEARQFADILDARAMWVTRDPRAPAERPLTAFSVTFEPVGV